MVSLIPLPRRLDRRLQPPVHRFFDERLCASLWHLIDASVQWLRRLALRPFASELLPPQLIRYRLCDGVGQPEPPMFGSRIARKGMSATQVDKRDRSL